jgi:GxxExxY protein
MDENALSNQIIGMAIEVHKQLGPGLLESAYELCLAYELDQSGIPYERQKELPVIYKDMHLDCNYRMDILLDRKVIVEIKAEKVILPIHEAQLLTYLKLSNLKLGLLLNFNVPVLRHGIRRIVNNL